MLNEVCDTHSQRCNLLLLRSRFACFYILYSTSFLLVLRICNGFCQWNKFSSSFTVVGVLVTVLQRNRANICNKVLAHAIRGCEVPWSAACKLEKSGRPVVWFKGLWARQLMVQIPWIWRQRAEDWHSAQQSGRERILPPSAFLFYSGPRKVRRYPPALRRAIRCTQSTNSNANLF